MARLLRVVGGAWPRGCRAPCGFKGRAKKTKPQPTFFVFGEKPVFHFLLLSKSPFLFCGAFRRHPTPNPVFGPFCFCEGAKPLEHAWGHEKGNETPLVGERKKRRQISLCRPPSQQKWAATVKTVRKGNAPSECFPWRHLPHSISPIAPPFWDSNISVALGTRGIVDQ